MSEANQTDESTPQLYGRVRAAITREMDHLERQAQAIADEFWGKHFSYRHDEHREHWGTYGVRVRRRTNSLSIDWYRMVFYGPPGQRQKTHNHVKRGEGVRYPRSAFRRARAWEIEAIMAAEERFAKIRKAAERLAEVARQARYYDATVRALDATPTATGDV